MVFKLRSNDEGGRMPFYSDELIEEVRARNDIVDVISGYVRLQKKGNTYFGLCPFHNEKTGSFSVSPHKQMFYCFGCGVGGNVLTFIQKYENFTFQETMEMLADRAGVALPKYEMTSAQKKEADKRARLLEINKEAAKYFYTLLRNPRGQRAYQYFKNRELTDETMQKFGLGYSDQYSDDLYRYLKSKGYGDDILKESGLITLDEVRGGHDKFWNRAMFPIMDVHNHVIGFGGRVMGEGEPKYLNSPETKVFDKSRNLYGLNIARSTRKDQLLLCEGYMDVIALHQAGFDNAVASLGTSLTSGHANLLKRYYSSSTTVTAQTAETLAGEAAVAIAHGADKICLNEYVNANMLKVVGSYDTVMAHDRVHHVTYNSAVQNWVNSYNNQLPKTFNQSTNAIRIPIGNIPEGATVKVRITYENAYFQYTNSDSEYESTYPSDELPSVKVYVNSQECIYNGAVNGTKVYGNGSYEFMDRFVQMGYDYNTFEYTVPEEGYITIEHDDGTEENILVFDLYDEGYGYIVFELLPDVDGESFKLYGVQVIVDVP